MTFDIETLELATELLLEKEHKEVLQSFSTKIKASSQSHEKIVNYGKQSFIKGMRQAYADHRPFTLSPDILWLLICQGFSRHVNNNSNELRKLLVTHKGKKELIVKNNNLLKHPEEWKNVISSFTVDIKKNIKNDLVEILSPNFSTTTSISKIACEITILDTFKSFFEYTVLTGICGIPQITLNGTLEDWINLKEKAQKLATYNLSWWIDSISPILDKIIETKKGTIDKAFWMNMYKTHTANEYGASEKITGWIAKFFPYDRFGIKTADKEIDINNLPDELTYTDFKWVITSPQNTVTHSMQFVAGFTGLHQCPSSLSLEPQIGWFVCESIKKKEAALPITNSDSVLNFYQIDEMPKNVLKCKELSSLGLSFNDKINIPYSIGKMKIVWLDLYGEITKKERNRLRRILPFTFIVFNGSNEEAIIHAEKKNHFYKFISRIRQFIQL
jgi:hypothetical protein